LFKMTPNEQKTPPIRFLLSENLINIQFPKKRGGGLSRPKGVAVSEYRPSRE
jgi:hypothetical protein